MLVVIAVMFVGALLLISEWFDPRQTWAKVTSAVVALAFMRCVSIVERRYPRAGG